jgi:hypothetical protein
MNAAQASLCFFLLWNDCLLILDDKNKRDEVQGPAFQPKVAIQ